ncbi:MAG: DoxX family protein [Alphaproteobacteria bacterium]|nr:DoxX family protein [Alphaproteobacteria bacterium]
MNALTRLHNGVFGFFERLFDGWFLGLLARVVFSSVTLLFFWNSAKTKIGTGLLTPSTGAYAQIFPKKFEAAGYDADAMSGLDTAIVLAGTYAEFLLPALILIGLFTRLSAVGMIGFIVVMSIVDINGHGLDAKTIGAVFDRIQDGVVADQRLLWLFPLVYLALKGAGVMSLDGVFSRTRRSASVE